MIQRAIMYAAHQYNTRQEPDQGVALRELRRKRGVVLQCRYVPVASSSAPPSPVGEALPQVSARPCPQASVPPCSPEGIQWSGDQAGRRGERSRGTVGGRWTAKGLRKTGEGVESVPCIHRNMQHIVRDIAHCVGLHLTGQHRQAHHSKQNKSVCKRTCWVSFATAFGGLRTDTGLARRRGVIAATAFVAATAFAVRRLGATGFVTADFC